jgi:hypothetical protein
VLWLQEPTGASHTWDDTLLDDFEKLAAEVD